MSRPIVIDTDPGKDDAVAILLALASPALDVRALIAVAGNVSVARTSENALRLAALAGRADVPVYAGCAGPMLRQAVTAEHVHGADGLGGLALPPSPATLRPGHGVDALIELIHSCRPTLCLLGPATNLAMALTKAPEIAGLIPQVVWMAGAAREGGNVTPAAEYNVYADPEAAQKVVESGLDLTLVPLDLTHQVRFDAARRARLRAIDGAGARAVAALFPDDEPLHDPCVIAHLLDPGLFGGAHLPVAVETRGAHTLGMTVVDRHRVSGRAANAHWLDRANADGFFALLLGALAPVVAQEDGG